MGSGEKEGREENEGGGGGGREGGGGVKGGKEGWYSHITSCVLIFQPL